MKYLLIVFLLGVGSAKAQESKTAYYNHLADSCLNKADEWKRYNNWNEAVKCILLSSKYLDTARIESIRRFKELKQLAQLKMDLELITLKPIDSTLFKQIDSLLKQN